MKKEKESFWQLLKKLDEQSGQFNAHLHEANRYFDEAASKTAKLLHAQEEQRQDDEKACPSKVHEEHK